MDDPTPYYLNGSNGYEEPRDSSRAVPWRDVLRFDTTDVSYWSTGYGRRPIEGQRGASRRVGFLLVTNILAACGIEQKLEFQK